MPERSFNILASVAGTLIIPPDATLIANGLPSFADGGRLYGAIEIFFQNIGGEDIEIRTSPNGRPANSVEATVVKLRLRPAQRDIIINDPGDANDDLGIPTHRFYAFSQTVNTPLIVDPR